MNRIKKLVLIMFVITACGCSNPYKKYYQDYTDGAGVIGNPSLIEPTNPPEIRRGNDLFEETKEMLRNGYSLIGESGFNAGEVKEKKAYKQACKVHAEVVILYHRYTDTLSGNMPVSVPDTQYSTSNYSGNINSSGRSADFYGSSNTTTYGNKTMYMPYHIRRYDFNATYWVKAKPYAFGVMFKELNDQQRQEIQSNKGIAIFVVVRGTPAFQNDILEGDIIRKINDIEIMDEKHCISVLKDNVGKEISITLFRNSQHVTKHIKLNNLN